jgi:hypothetical protein
MIKVRQIAFLQNTKYKNYLIRDLQGKSDLYGYKREEKGWVGLQIKQLKCSDYQVDCNKEE